MEYQLRYHLWPIIVRKQLNFQIYKQKISSKKIVRNINWESFIYSEVRIRYCDIFDYNCKISNTWYCFLHICSWGIHYFYIDKLQPTSLVYHSSQLFSNWILNSPRESSNLMTPFEEELPATMNSPIPSPIDKMPAVDVGIGHLWMVVMFWNHDGAIHLSQWNQIFLDKYSQQIVASKDGNHQRCLCILTKSSFIGKSNHFPNQSFFDCLKNEQVESAQVKEWKNGKPEQMSLQRLE